VWHDASLFRMVRQVEAELDQQGSRIQRVILDDELKGTTYRALHEARSSVIPIGTHRWPWVSLLPMFPVAPSPFPSNRGADPPEHGADA
jgi:hypothetical protein